MKMLLPLFLCLIGSQTSVTQTLGCKDTEEADIYFLIDGSTSIQPTAFGDIKTFLKEVIKMFNVGQSKVRFGAVQYSHFITKEFDLNEFSNGSNLENAIDNIRQIYGDTYIGAALTFMQPLLKEAREQRASRVPCHLIFLTDGASQDSVKEPAERLRNEQVNIYSIGIKDANEAQLHEISGSKSRTYFVRDFDSLKGIKNDVVQEICSGSAPKEMKADIMFLVDSSGSIGDDNFLKIKDFMRELVSKSDIGADRVQVGVVQFSGRNKEEFQLDRYSSESDIFSAIERMFLIGENTLTGNALTFVSEYFKPSKGARPGVKKFLILITDGEAQDEVQTPARALREQGVVIYSVGVMNANKAQLEEISGKRELVFYVETFDILKHLEDEIIFGIGSSSEECKRIERLDAVFVIDESGSISVSQYQTMKDFMIALVNKSDVGPDRVQFGAVKYSDEPRTFFYLNMYSTKSEIVEAIQSDSSVGGSTYTAKAIDYSEAFFVEDHGSRKHRGVPQILIVITDGESHDAAQLNDTAKRLRDNGIIIYAVGIEGAKSHELLAMAGSEDKYYYVDTFEELQNIFVQMSEKMCDMSRRECEIQADLVFLIDGSGSIGDTDFIKMKNFMKDVVDQLNYDHIQVGIAQFSHSYKKEIGLGDFQSKSELNVQIQKIKQIGGGTEIGAALKHVKEFFAPAMNRRVRRNVKPVLLVVTDGESQDDVAGPAKDLRNEGVEIYAVGVGGIDHTQLVQIAGAPERKYTVDNFSELKSIKKRLANDIRTPTDRTACKEMKADIMFLVDSSGSIGDDNFSKIKDFITELVKKSDIGADRVQVGVVQFSGRNKEEFQLDRYSSKSDIFSAIERMFLIGENTLTGNALTFVSEYFKPSKGARPGVKKFLILITDGEAQDEVQTPARALREQGVVIYSVGVMNANKAQLEEISGKRELVFYVETFDILKRLEDEIIFGIGSFSEHEHYRFQ